MEEDMERALEEEGARPGINIKFREGYEAPRRIEPGGRSTALEGEVAKNESDLKEISGINDSALGNLDRVQSGRAIQARQRQSVVSAEMYFDNFSRSRELKARREIGIIQGYYTEPRIVRIRSGTGGQDEQIFINRKDAAGAIVNNVTLGKYDLAIDESPMSATFMQGQFQEALELLEKGIPIPPDVLVDLSSMPNKETIKQRISEQRMIDETTKRLQTLGLQASVGIPPNVPAPPVMTDGGPAVVVVPAGQPGPLTVPPVSALPGVVTPPPGGAPAGSAPPAQESALQALPPLEPPYQQ